MKKIFKYRGYLYDVVRGSQKQEINGRTKNVRFWCSRVYDKSGEEIFFSFYNSEREDAETDAKEYIDDLKEESRRVRIATRIIIVVLCSAAAYLAYFL